MSSVQFAPMLSVRDAAAAMTWYQTSLGAVETMRLVDPSGVIVHGELTIGQTLIMLFDESSHPNSSPDSLGGTPVVLHLLYSDGVDEAFARVLSGGASVVFPLKDQFYGYRAGRVRDPFGHEWILSQKMQDLTPQEMQHRFDELLAQNAAE